MAEQVEKSDASKKAEEALERHEAAKEKIKEIEEQDEPPKDLKDWPDDDHGNRLVCISRDIPEQDIALTLPALNTPAGTQAIYSMEELRKT